MKNKLLLLFLCLTLASCGGMTKNDDRDAPLEPEDNIEMQNSDDMVEGEETVVLDENVSEDENSPTEETNMASSGDAGDAGLENEGSSQISSGDYAEHIVQKGETLGVIAAKLYGDFRKWRLIYLENEETIGANSLRAGTVLRYQMPDHGQVVMPEGTPYMILRDDTLGIIAGKVYNGASKHWKYIWNNNKNLIYNPDLIFAGLTLYYLPLEEKMKRRNVANQI